MVTQIPPEGLTPVEQSLVEHVGRGEWLDLTARGEAINLPAMRSWDDSRNCRSTVIRDILRGQLVADPDPRGLRLRGARIFGLLDLEGVTTNVRLQLNDCLIEEGIFAPDAQLVCLDLTGCRIGHRVEPPLDLPPLQVERYADVGAIELTGAHISTTLDCAGTQIRNDSGPALSADRLQVDQSILLGNGFTAIGSGAESAVRLMGAHIGGSLYCTRAHLRNDSGPALSADRLQVDQSIFLDDGFTAIGSGAYTISLRGARIGGTLNYAPALLQHVTDSYRRLDVDGLTYSRVPQGVPVRGWLELMRHGTKFYAAQPYQQLAAGCRALGDERQTREILIAQRKDQLAWSDHSLRERLWGQIIKVTLGYGYQPWRALLFLAGVLALSCILAVVLGSHGALTQTASTVNPSRPCTVFQEISVGLDLNLPISTILARAGCDLARNPANTPTIWLATAGWLLRLMAWAFAALFIAGFTSAVRKT